MNTPTISIGFTFRREFLHVSLGDQRLNRRVVRIADAALLTPESSIPKLAGNASQAEGVYRFVANPRVTVAKVSRTHQEQTVVRAGEAGPVLVLGDSSTMGYGKETRRTGLGPTAAGGKGFILHASLCVQESTGKPLGVLRHRTFVRPIAVVQDGEKPKRGSRANRKAQDDPNNESQRWLTQALEAGKALGDVPHVHVADRESDDYKYLALLDAAGESFVSRASTNRNLAGGADLFGKLDGMVVQLCRSVRLGHRKASPSAGGRKANPPRGERPAKLQISAGTAEIPRTQFAPRSTVRSLKLNYVLVQEVEVPVGETPVVWRLTTNLPVDTPEQIARVVDIYRARWIIEEFFKALKTGCAFEDHQLESYEALTKLLAVLLVVAWKMLEIRTVARMTPDAPATMVLTKQQVRVLRILHDRGHPKTPLPIKPTVRQVMYAVAGLAGHFKSNGDPGWQTLGRGLQRLLQAEQDAMALLPLLSQRRSQRAD